MDIYKGLKISSFADFAGKLLTDNFKIIADRIENKNYNIIDVADETARLALTNIKIGDFVQQADNFHVYRLIASNISSKSSWLNLGVSVRGMKKVFSMVDTNAIYDPTSDIANTFTLFSTSTGGAVKFYGFDRGIYLDYPNRLTTIDLSGKLTQEAWLADIDFSNCINLYSLDVSNGQIRDLNLSNTAAGDFLMDLTLSGSTVRNLFVPQKITQIRAINCANLASITTDGQNITGGSVKLQYCNHLTNLSISGASLISNIEITGCTNLNFLNISSTNVGPLFTLDGTVNGLNDLELFSATNTANLKTLVLKNHPYLSNVTVNGAIETINLIDNPLITNVTCTDTTLKSFVITGSVNSGLNLFINNNQLKSLDLSGIDHLNTLNCSSNQLTSLILPNINQNITSINGSNNYLSSVQLPLNVVTAQFQNNKLTSFDFTNVTNFRVDGNALPSNEIDRLLIKYAASNWQNGYSIYMHNGKNGARTAASDSAYNALKDQGILILNDYTPSVRILAGSKRQDYSLWNTQYAIFSDNHSSINTYLNDLYVAPEYTDTISEIDCSGSVGADASGSSSGSGGGGGTGGLSNLNPVGAGTFYLSSLTNLVTFRCLYNSIESIDAHGLTSLETINAGYNKLTSLDLTGCSALSTLNVDENQLITLNLSGLNALQFLLCLNNLFTTLTIADLPELLDLECDGNVNLTDLVLNNLPALTSLYSTNCKLSASSVDNIFLSLQNTNNTDGVIHIGLGNNAAPTSASANARTALENKGWILLTN